ncbi:MAG: zinc-ribbon domain-containing protein [Acidobacteria bacterium]|nr:zinc-ribbon domain-containing protein [Acidobacteriota bacterium]
MFCTRCGTANSDDMMFCTNCSGPLIKSPTTTRINDQPTTRQGVQRNMPPRPAQPAYDEPKPVPEQNLNLPYPGYRSAYSGSQGYQPFQSSYAQQVSDMQGSASPRAITSMVLSLVSIVTCGPFLSIPALIIGKMEMNDIVKCLAPKAGETFAKIGFYLGIATTAFYCLLGVLWGLLLTIGQVS